MCDDGSNDLMSKLVIYCNEYKRIHSFLKRSQVLGFTGFL